MDESVSKSKINNIFLIACFLHCSINSANIEIVILGEFVDILGGMLDSKYKDSIGMLSVCQTLAALAGMKQVDYHSQDSQAHARHWEIILETLIF